MKQNPSFVPSLSEIFFGIISVSAHVRSEDKTFCFEETSLVEVDKIDFSCSLFFVLGFHSTQPWPLDKLLTLHSYLVDRTESTAMLAYKNGCWSFLPTDKCCDAVERSSKTVP